MPQVRLDSPALAVSEIQKITKREREYPHTASGIIAPGV
jgi:hypothetical protein